MTISLSTWRRECQGDSRMEIIPHRNQDFLRKGLFLAQVALYIRIGNAGHEDLQAGDVQLKHIPAQPKTGQAIPGDCRRGFPHGRYI